MALTITRSFVDGATLAADRRGRRELVVPCKADGVDVSGATDTEVMVKLLEDSAFPDFNSSLSVTYPEYKLDRAILRASMAKLKRVHFDLIYSTETGGDVNAYVIDDRSYVTQIQTQRIGNQWIRVSYIPGEEAPEADNIPEDNVTISYQMPMRAIRVTRIIAGELSDAVRNQVGKVNSGFWKGLAPGQWLCCAVASSYAKYGAITTYNIEALGFVDPLESWATYGVLRSQMTGRYAVVDNTTLSGLVGTPYSPGLIYPGGDDAKGIVKVCPYLGTDFASLFGFN